MPAGCFMPRTTTNALSTNTLAEPRRKVTMSCYLEPCSASSTGCANFAEMRRFPSRFGCQISQGKAPGGSPVARKVSCRFTCLIAFESRNRSTSSSSKLFSVATDCLIPKNQRRQYLVFCLQLRNICVRRRCGNALLK